jgi:hypothetical protein
MVDIATVNVTLNAPATSTAIQVPGIQGAPGAVQSVSVVGTANQVAVSGATINFGHSTGTFTLTLPQNVVIPTPASGNALTLTGAATGSPLQINTGGAQQGITISGASGNARGILYETAGSLRWFTAANQTTETGSNVGSDYGIFSFSDAGAFLGNPILVQRSTGNVTIAPPYGTTPALTVNGNGTQVAFSVNGLLGNRISQFNTTNTGGGYIAYERSGVDIGFLGDSSQLDSGTLDDITIRATHGLGFATNGANRRMTIGSGGNVTINAPTSGTTLTVNSIANGNAAVLNGTVTVTGTSGGAFAQSLGVTSPFGSTATSRADLVLSSPSTVAGAYTLPIVDCYEAQFNTLGAGSAITNLIGFRADSSLGGIAPNGYGYFGNLAAATGQWNFYAAGTAANFFQGAVTIGTVATGVALTVTGNASNGVMNSINNGAGSSYIATLNVAGTGLGITSPAATNCNVFSLTQSGQSTWNLSNSATTNNLTLSEGSGGTIWSQNGNVSILAPASGSCLTLTGLANSYAQIINGSATSGQSLGLIIKAGTTNADFALAVQNQAGSTLMNVNGAGNVTIAAPTSGAGLTISSSLAAPSIYVGVDNFTGAGSVAQLSLQAANNTNGSNIQLVGNGATTPNKTIRVQGGLFQILNNAYSSAPLSLTDAGALTIQSTMNASSYTGAGTGLTGTAASLTSGAAGNLSGGAANSIPYQTGVGTTGMLSMGTTGQLLTATTGGAPSWTSPSLSLATNLSGGAAGELPYQSAASTTSFTAAGTSGQVLVSGGTGSPTWTSTPTFTSAFVNGAALGTTVGSQTIYSQLQSADANGDVLILSNTRTIAGTDWTGAGSRLQQKVDATWSGYIQFNNGSASASNNNGISFGTGGSTVSAVSIAERMRIDGSGNVLIGTTTQSGTALLTINGTAAATTFNGAGTGLTGTAASLTAGVATQVTATSTATAASFFPTFVASSTTGSQGIGMDVDYTYNPSTNVLTVGTLNTTSDRNAKTNIRTISSSEEIIASLNGVRFDFKKSGIPSAGLIAQDVEVLMPELVTTNESGDKSLNYNGIIGVLVEAFKELKASNDALKLEVAALKQS